MIGCVALVYHGRDIVGLKCAKGRGVILPGGKWEKGETFVECALRELKEETGLIGSHPKFLFAGESEDGFFVYTFSIFVANYVPVNSDEGKVVLTDWHELKKSHFKGYYEILEMLERAEDDRYRISAAEYSGG